MSQPKHRRRAARRQARAHPTRGISIICSLTTGAVRNPLGQRASLDTLIAVGFGAADVTCEALGIHVDGDHQTRGTRQFFDRYGYCTLRQVERVIRRRRGHGRHEWTAAIHGPLWSATWERQGPGRWVCVEAGEGFA